MILNEKVLIDYFAVKFSIENIIHHKYVIYSHIQGKLKQIQKAFSSFLALYPYCYGYWKKYADQMKKIVSNEAAFQVLLPTWPPKFHSIIHKTVKIIGRKNFSTFAARGRVLTLIKCHVARRDIQRAKNIVLCLTDYLNLDKQFDVRKH